MINNQLTYTTHGCFQIYIRLLDLGESWEVHQKDLRVLDDVFYASPPAQVSDKQNVQLFE